MSVFKLQPTELTDSSKQFKIPSTIRSDYTNYLHTEVEHVIYDFQLLRSWYDQFDETKEKVMLRAEHFPINWKSKIGNSDANKNFYTDYETRIQKGDMVIREDGLIGMLNWSIQGYINAQTTQMIECNHRITVTREVPAQADKRGIKIADATTAVIVDDLPCVMSEYAGRPDFAVAQNTPGIQADMLTTISMQFNEKTKNIRVGDEFLWGVFNYRVVNINYAEIDISQTYGVLTLNARRIAGENV